MRGSAIAASLALSLTAMSAVPVFAQPAPAPARPAQPAPAQPAPAAPAQPPATPARAARRSRRRRSRRARRSRSSTHRPCSRVGRRQGGRRAEVNALIQKKQTENADKAKLLQGNQQKLQTSGSVMNEAARDAAREGNRAADARTPSASSRTRRPRSTSCSRKLQNEFVRRSCCRSSSSSRTRRACTCVFNAVESGIAWAAPGLDLDR